MQNNAYQQMAKDFMDLWQKQVASVVSDKQFIHAMLDMFQTMRMPNHDGKKPAATADASPAPDADHGLLAELAFRLAMCEKRLAALEQRKPAAKPKAGASGRRGSKKPRK